MAHWPGKCWRKIISSAVPDSQAVFLANQKQPARLRSDWPAAIGRPGASRAVGSANSRNPIAIVVPCHRVIGANGELIGYASGLERKRWLLRHEQAALQAAHTDPEFAILTRSGIDQRWHQRPDGRQSVAERIYEEAQRKTAGPRQTEN